jgi:hypothetical protein
MLVQDSKLRQLSSDTNYLNGTDERTSYGVRGGAVITSTLLGLFPMNKTPTDAFKPLPHQHFFDYFITPYIAASLIATDNDTTIVKAYAIMKESSDAGALLNAVQRDNDPELEDIFKKNVDAFGAQWVVRSATQTEFGSDLDPIQAAAAGALLSLKVSEHSSL